MARILVVEDNALNIKLFCDLLNAHGHETEPVSDSRDALDAARAFKPDLVITDLAMPRADGYAVISAIRRIDRTPVLVLSVRGEEEDKVRALDLGADDYVTKPFSLRELLARVRTQLRRGTGAAREILRFPDLEIDLPRRSVNQGGREVRLTPTEFAILELLASQAGRPVTLRQIVAAVWKGAPATTASS